MVINVDSVKVGIIYQTVKSFVINEGMMKAESFKEKAKNKFNSPCFSQCPIEPVVDCLV